MGTPRKSEARVKYARIKSAMESGRAHGEAQERKNGQK